MRPGLVQASLSSTCRSCRLCRSKVILGINPSALLTSDGIGKDLRPGLLVAGESVEDQEIPAWFSH
jgi:hypothetical protein